MCFATPGCKLRLKPELEIRSSYGLSRLWPTSRGGGGSVPSLRRLSLPRESPFCGIPPQQRWRSFSRYRPTSTPPEPHGYRQSGPGVRRHFPVRSGPADLARISHRGFGRAGLQPRRYERPQLFSSRAPRAACGRKLRGERHEKRVIGAISAGLKPRPSDGEQTGEKSRLRLLETRNEPGVASFC